MKLGDLNQAEAAEIVKKENMIALLPIGATEVHGNHLPLSTDTYLAGGIADLVEQRLGMENCLVLPAVPYGQVWSLRSTPGTIDIPNEVFTEFLTNIAMSMYRAGVKKMAFINGHVGNLPAIKAAMRNVYAQCDMKVYSFSYPGAEKAIEQVCTTKRPHKSYFHACEIETSYMLYLCPDKVDMKKAICQYPEFPKEIDVSPTPWTDFMDIAVLGDATAATAEKGKAIIDTVVDEIIRLMN